jgi:hypothetical protein
MCRVLDSLRDDIAILRSHALFDIAKRTSPSFPLADDIPYMTL